MSHNEGPARVGGGGSCLVIYRSWRIVEGRAAEETFFSLAREREREGEEAYSIFPYVTCRAVDDARSFELRRVSAREFVFVVVVGCDCIGWKHKICTFAEKLN